MNIEETPKDTLPEDTAVPVQPAGQDAPSSSMPVEPAAEPVVDADLADAVSAAAAEIAPEPVMQAKDFREWLTETVEPPAAASAEEAAPAPAADAVASAPSDEVAPPEAASAEAAAADDEEIILPRTRRKAAAKPKSDAVKTPRKPAKKKLKLPDLGDGSGYIAPDEVENASEEAPWFAVHCYSGQENKVKTNLEQRIETMGMAGKILKIIVPTEDEIEVRDGKRKTVKRQVFPGYVLVQMHMSEESWFVVRNTPGVTRFVGMGNRPQPLSQQEVNVLLGRMTAEAPKIKVNFRAGQKVRITDGPFADFIGVVDKIDTERAKVVALVSFFGRETPVELDFLQVEKT